MLMPQTFLRSSPERPPPLKCDDSLAQPLADVQEKTVDTVHRPKNRHGRVALGRKRRWTHFVSEHRSLMS